MARTIKELERDCKKVYVHCVTTGEVMMGDFKAIRRNFKKWIKYGIIIDSDECEVWGDCTKEEMLGRLLRN